MDFTKKLGNKPDFFYTNEVKKEESATIPGSSLRGMLRNLLEIVSYSKISFVQDTPKMFYRAVAAPSNDSLGTFYKNKIKNLKAGYLKKDKNSWKIIPALIPRDVWDIPEKKPFLTIKNYAPQFRKISFNATVETSMGDNGKSKNYLSISDVGDESVNFTYKGYLVCSGNMLENDSVGNVSPRNRHSIVLEKDTGQIVVIIPEQIIQDYKNSLTSFLKENPFSEKSGCLIDGNPVFYLEENEKILAFGHTPNFRLPAYLNSEKRAATPIDFVPKEIRMEEQVDFTEAMFGFIKRSGSEKAKSYSSRIFVSSAVLNPNQSEISFAKIVPSILASPKPTAFQHYLVQESENRSDLNHYSSKTPDETVIRGHKLYWHRGNIGESDIKAKPNSPNVDNAGKVDETSKVHTQFKPMKPEVSFKFKIYFENLSNEELGALCWVLKPQGENNKTYYHKLGMGKAFGMGAVSLDSEMFLENRVIRYTNLFTKDKWGKGEVKANEEKWQCFSNSFEKKILTDIQSEHNSLSEIQRIKMLLKMMEWEEKPDLSFKMTPDFNAENNDFKERRILPNPLYKKPQTTTRQLVMPKKI
jgi:CRISPR-associated protein (TIGR03986 family)